MNWINNIFNRKSNPTNNVSSMNAFEDSIPEVEVPRELFIDEKEPVSQEETTVEAKNLLVTFLEEDYYGKGYNDGYMYHATETMINSVKSIKSKFRLILDQSIEKKNALKLKTENAMIDSEGISERIGRQYQGVIQNITRNIERLEMEKKLSAEDEGLVMNAINPYKDGFTRGLEKYHFERNLGLSTGLFNE